jgi:hypothetical protein
MNVNISIAPTKEMQAYAAFASLGDDVYHEPSTIALERHIAKITGKQAGLFMPTGTMSNQVALRCHLVQPPHSGELLLQVYYPKFSSQSSQSSVMSGPTYTGRC